MISLRKASELAVTAHADQVDKAGNPYHFHVLALRSGRCDHVKSSCA